MAMQGGTSDNAFSGGSEAWNEEMARPLLGLPSNSLDIASPSSGQHRSLSSVEAVLAYMVRNPKFEPIVVKYGIAELTRRAEAVASGRTPVFDNQSRPPLGQPETSLIGRHQEQPEDAGTYGTDLAKRAIDPIIPLGDDDPWGEAVAAEAVPTSAAHPDPFTYFKAPRRS